MLIPFEIRNFFMHERIQMEFDKEMDDAAQTIQKKYRQKQKNRINKEPTQNVDEKPHNYKQIENCNLFLSFYIFLFNK